MRRHNNYFVANGTFIFDFSWQRLCPLCLIFGFLWCLLQKRVCCHLCQLNINTEHDHESITQCVLWYHKREKIKRIGFLLMQNWTDHPSFYNISFWW